MQKKLMKKSSLEGIDRAKTQKANQFIRSSVCPLCEHRLDIS